jgi:REP element-mobilizing transposase RayT
MPRRPRLEEAGAIHHVFARGIAQREIYVDAADRVFYLELLEWVVDHTGWRCFAYCLMDNHVHLLVQTPEPNLGFGMHRLHGDYARAFNRRHGRSGHVFQGRYESRRVMDDPYFLTLASYIALNPVEAGVCDAPEQWPWGSHRYVIDGEGPTWLADRELLDHFGAWGGDPMRRYAEFVRNRLPDAHEAPAPPGGEPRDGSSRRSASGRSL